MIALGLVSLFLTLTESIEIKRIFLKDGSQAELQSPLTIEGKIPTKLLYLYSTLSPTEIVERLAKRDSPNSPLEFCSGEAYRLCPKLDNHSNLPHPIDKKVYIKKTTNQQVYKFKVTENASVARIVEAKRSEPCALNAERFLFASRRTTSLNDINYGLSEPFRVTLNDSERQGLKFDRDFMLKDLEEIFSLLKSLKNEGFEGNLEPEMLDEIIVMGLDGRLKLIVPAVVGTKISILIDEFFKCDSLNIHR